MIELPTPLQLAEAYIADLGAENVRLKAWINRLPWDFGRHRPDCEASITRSDGDCSCHVAPLMAAIEALLPTEARR